LFLSELRQISTDFDNVWQNCQMNIDELKTRLVNEWAQFDQSIIDAVISQ